MGPKIEDHAKLCEISSKSKVFVLARHVKRHHAPNHIIGDKFDGTMTRYTFKVICFLIEFEPRNVEDAFNNESYIEAMNEEI